MAAHSSILAWEVPWTGEPGGLSTWDHERVRHNLATEQQQQLINSVSGVQQRDSVIQIHVCILFQVLFPLRI